MMFQADPEVPIVCLNGRYKRRVELDVLDTMSSEEFKKGCFETMLAVNRMVPLLDRHLARLQLSADFLEFQLPESCNRKQILESVIRLYDLYDGEESRFRTRLTVFPIGGDDTGWLLNMDPIVLPSKPYRLKISPHLREYEPIRALKCKRSARDHYMQAYYDAVDDNFDDALMLTIDGYVSETTIANVFWIKGETLYTPSEKCYPLSGVGREVLQECIAEQGLSLFPGEYSISDVLAADLVFIINSVRGPVPVSQIDHHTRRVQRPVFARLFEQYWAKVLEDL